MGGHADLIEPDQDRLRLDSVDAQAHQVGGAAPPQRRGRTRAPPRWRAPPRAADRSGRRLGTTPRRVPGRSTRRPRRRSPPRPGCPRARCAGPVLVPRPPGTEAAGPRAAPAAPRPFRGHPACGPTVTAGRRPRCRTTSARCPAAAASTWTSTPRSRHAATTSATGWRVPTSWLAHWQWTRAVLGPMASSRASTSMRPSPSTGVTLSRPARSDARRTAECSTPEQTM